MNFTPFSPQPRTALLALTLCLGASCPLTAQVLTPAVPITDGAPVPSEDRQRMAAGLIGAALDVAQNHPEARGEALRDAAGVLPRLAGPARDRLTARWLKLALSPELSRTVRVRALSSFFDVAAGHDPEWARKIAWPLPDAAGRASGFLELSQHFLHLNWDKSNEYALLAQRAARQEENDLLRARALAFVAQNFSIVNPEEMEGSVREASIEVRRLENPAERDYLLTEVVSAATKFDLKLARKIAGDIKSEQLRGLAEARCNIAEASQTTVTVETADRVQKLLAAAARYDVRALPLLLQLPASPQVFKVISDALPAIYPSAQSSISPEILERIWKFAGDSEASVYKDQLQSRLARLMVLHDLWRGRAWGKRLTWKGGRIQVGAFLKEVIRHRQSELRVDPLQDLAQRNIRRAIAEARTLPAEGQVEALMLMAQQVLG